MTEVCLYVSVPVISSEVHDGRITVSMREPELIMEVED